MMLRIFLALAFLTTLPLFADESAPVSAGYIPSPAQTQREPMGIKAPEEPVNVGGGYQMPEREDDRGDDSSDYSSSSED